MKKLLVIGLLLISSGAWAEWTGKSLWESMDSAHSSRSNYASDFVDGYFRGIEAVTPFSTDEKPTWISFHYLLNGFDLARAVDNFYKVAGNEVVPDPIALLAAEEYAISKKADGIRLLNKVYAQVGGWKPFTTWQQYKIDHGIQ